MRHLYTSDVHVQDVSECCFYVINIGSFNCEVKNHDEFRVNNVIGIFVSHIYYKNVLCMTY